MQPVQVVSQVAPAVAGSGTETARNAPPRPRQTGQIVPRRPTNSMPRVRPPARPLISATTLSTTPSAPAALIFPPRHDMAEQTAPGPGSYNVEAHIPHVTKSSPRIFQPLKEWEDPPFLRNLARAPGPGAYDVAQASQSVKAGTKAVSIARRPRQLTLAEERQRASPGPASYNMPAAGVGSRGAMGCASRGFSFGGRPFHKANQKGTKWWTPGPGSYHPRPPLPVSSAPSFGGRRRCPGTGGADAVPGPGAYNDPREMAAQWKSSTANVSGKCKGVTFSGRTTFYMPMKGQGPPSTNYDTRPALPAPTRRSKTTTAAVAVVDTH